MVQDFFNDGFTHEIIIQKALLYLVKENHRKNQVYVYSSNTIILCGCTE